MDLCGSPSQLSVLNFHTKYRKEIRGKYDRADPLFDAWMTITGKQRPEFEVQIFKQNNPSLSEKVDEIRAKCGVCLCWIDREEKKRYIFNWNCFKKNRCVMTIKCQFRFLCQVSKRVWTVKSVGHENNMARI